MHSKLSCYAEIIHVTNSYYHFPHTLYSWSEVPYISKHFRQSCHKTTFSLPWTSLLYWSVLEQETRGPFRGPIFRFSLTRPFQYWLISCIKLITCILSPPQRLLQWGKAKNTKSDFVSILSRLRALTFHLSPIPSPVRKNKRPLRRRETCIHSAKLYWPVINCFKNHNMKLPVFYLNLQMEKSAGEIWSNWTAISQMLYWLQRFHLNNNVLFCLYPKSC